MTAADDTRTEIADLIDGYDDGTYSCDCSGEVCEIVPCDNNRQGLAEIIAEYVATKQAEALREFTRDQRDRMARAWGGNAGWMTTGTGVADVVCDWINEEADDIADRIAP